MYKNTWKKLHNCRYMDNCLWRNTKYIYWSEHNRDVAPRDDEMPFISGIHNRRKLRKLRWWVVSLCVRGCVLARFRCAAVSFPGLGHASVQCTCSRHLGTQLIHFLDRGTQLVRPPVTLQTIEAQSLEFSVFLILVYSQLVKTAGSNAQSLARCVSAQNCTTRGKLGHPCPSGYETRWRSLRGRRLWTERQKTVHWEAVDCALRGSRLCTERQ
jgi:hypothetical protein